MTVIGVDLGATKTAAALVDAGGTTGPVASVPTPADLGPSAVLDAVAGLVGAVGGNAVPRVRAVGVGTAGVVDTTTGTIISATSSIAGWTGTDVRTGLRRRLTAALGADIAVSVENDVDAYAGGEAWLGAAHGRPSALVVAVGTGVGAAVVLNGRPLRGAHHVAGEIGHLPVPGADDRECTCGRPGHLEAVGAGPAMYNRYLALGGDPSGRDARDVAERATAGDECAIQAVREAATAVGRAIAGVVTVLDPAIVVVGGGVAESGRLWWDAMDRAVRRDVVEPLAAIPVVRTELGRTAPILGAARSAFALLDLDSAPHRRRYG